MDKTSLDEIPGMASSGRSAGPALVLPKFGPSKARKHRLKGDGFWPWLFILPLLSGVFVFYLWPIVQNFVISMSKVSPFGNSYKFVGFDNYELILTDGRFLGAFLNTVTFTAILLLGIPISVVLASLISQPNLRGANIYRTIYFMPYIAMPAAISIVWKMLYNGEYGIINYGLRLIGVDNPPYWLSTPGFALLAVAIMGIWGSIGFNMIIFAAGLKSIPRNLYDAAAIDGASRIRQFFSITVPLLTPSIFFLTIMQTIAGFQLFDTIFVLISPISPAMPKTKSLVYLFFEQSFQNNEKGAGAATAVLILLIIGVFTLIQFRLQKKWVSYV